MIGEFLPSLRTDINTSLSTRPEILHLTTSLYNSQNTGRKRDLCGNNSKDVTACYRVEEQNQKLLAEL